MRYRILGSTGLRVSAVGLGTWQFGGEWGHTFSQAEADAILDQAAASGINLLDTAECYGDHLSERLIGDYLSRHDRSRWVVATKFGHGFTGFLGRAEDFSATGVRWQLEASLRALRVERIDSEPACCVMRSRSSGFRSTKPHASLNAMRAWSLVVAAE